MNAPNEEHDPAREAMRAMISGYLDGELEPDERARFEQYVRDHPAFQEEIDEMRLLVEASDALEPAPVPDEVWDSFLDNVYNRLERRTGWTLTVIGAVAILLLALYIVVVIPWAPPLVKLGVEILLLGLGVLFISVLRQRLFMLKTDRYSRDIKR